MSIPLEQSSTKCGTLSRYKAGCKCDECKEASNTYERERRRRGRYGRPTSTLVDAEPARQHIGMLRAHHLGAGRIAELAGVDNGTIQRLLYPYHKRGKQPVRRLKPETAKAILAVKPIPKDGVHISAIGAQRRVRALIARGWSQKELARRLGLPEGHFGGIVRGEQVKITYRHHMRICEVYDELWNAPVEGTKRSIGLSLRRAREFGWAPPMAWDEGAIDDQHAEPVGMRDEAPSSRGRTRQVYLDDVEHLRKFGMSNYDIAKQLKVSPYTLRDVMRRDERKHALERPQEVAS